MKKILWSDFHSNMHHGHVENFLDEWYEHAKEMLDFWAIAYYPFKAYEASKEDITDLETIKEGIKQINDFSQTALKRDNFIVYPGYEWQGNGCDGDHNVFFKDNATFYNPMTYKELTTLLPLNDSMAISHHPGYAVGHRGKNWSTHDSSYSPVTEIYSSHGSSESDLSREPLDVHIHMGPKEGKGTVFSGLNKGAISGIICSGDNHCTPAISGNGFFGVVGSDGTKDGIFNSILNRNTYGVTRSRISLDYTINGHLMGSIIKGEKENKLKVDVIGTSAVDRVEVFKNGIVDKVYNHSGSWERKYLEDNNEFEFKFELEFGWGPDLRVYPKLNKKIWDISLDIDGEILDIEKLWKHPGQKIHSIQGGKATVTLTSTKEAKGNAKLSQKNYLSPYISNQSFIVNGRGKLDSVIKLTVDGLEYSYTVAEILESSKLHGDIKGAKKIAQDNFGFSEFYRSDPFWHNAYKFKIHKGTPSSGYKISFDYLVEREKDRDYFLVKVHQKNGDIAWSSPIWIDNN